MPEKISLQRVVMEVAGGGGMRFEFPDLLGALTQLSKLTEEQMEAVGGNTQAVIQNTIAQSRGGAGSAASTIGRAASTFFGSGLGLSPVISAIGKLFGGGKPEPPPPLVKFSLPPPVQFEGVSLGGQAGMPVPTSGPAPTIQIQVQAMDSRSFLDHSQEIARAVREAMLNMHSINDVVNDL
jgi:hypothetical protein